MISRADSNPSCNEVQVNLSLYLYGELDFAAEEHLERHLADCPMCQLALAREKRWHTTLNSTSQDVPAKLLADCRQGLFTTVRRTQPPRFRGLSSSFRSTDWLGTWGLRATRWSGQLAFASFFVFAGIMVSRWTDHSLPGPSFLGQMTVMGTPESRIRDIRPDSDGRIRIVVDQLEQREVVGSAADASIRRLLMAAARHSTDPGLRIDSVELLKEERGDDIRDALLSCVRHDENAAVRLKAVESLRRFSADPSTRQALIYLLERDPDSGVRSRAIDVLLPPHSRVQVGPELVRALEGVSRSDGDNDYVRSRCLQILQAVQNSTFTPDSVY